MDENQNDLMEMIQNHKEEEVMEENVVVKLTADIEAYKEALKDLHSAIATAELELAAALDAASKE